MMTEHARARLGVIAAAAVFSTGGAAIKLTALSGTQVACFRSAIAALAVLALAPESRRGWTWRTWVASLAYAACLTLFVLANKLTTSANTIFLQSAAPFYLLLLGPWLLKERVRQADLIVLGAMAAGLACVFLGTVPPRAPPWIRRWATCSRWRAGWHGPSSSSGSGGSGARRRPRGITPPRPRPRSCWATSSRRW